MKTLFKLLVLTLFLVITACSPDNISGLWLVEKVTAGEEEVTPVARWMRFNKDGTQQSGNGWKQHSTGSYEFDNNNRTLSIVNTNGYADPNEPFTVQLGEDGMVWTRKEEGQEIEVYLKKVEEIPQAPADKLLGVWDLTQVTDSTADVTNQYDLQNKRYLFIRWDNRFVIQHTPGGRLSGNYHTHGHRQQLQMIYYGTNCQTEQWEYEVNDNELILKSLNPKNKQSRKYQRIDHFPE